MDIVLPWTVAYRWTTRAASFEGRNILGFYSGTQNSCSRELLAKIFRRDFETQLRTMTGFDSEDEDGGQEMRIDPILNNRVVTYDQMCQGLATQLADLKVQLSESQLRSHWDNLRVAEAVRPQGARQARQG